MLIWLLPIALICGFVLGPMIPLHSENLKVVQVQTFQTTFNDQGKPNNYYLVVVLDQNSQEQTMLFSGTCKFGTTIFVYEGIGGVDTYPMT